MNEQQAILRLKQGDLEGLKTLVDKYQVKAVRAAYLMLKDRQLAEEVVQKAFLKIARRIDQFEVGSPFGPWFFRIVVNDARKVIRRQKRLVSVEEQLDDQTTQLAEWLIAPEPKPELLVELEESRQDVVQAVQSLPPEPRTAVVLYYYLGLTMKEMSERTEKPLSTIKWWLRDGRRRLKRLLDAPTPK